MPIMLAENSAKINVDTALTPKTTLTPKEAAHMLHVACSTLWRWRRDAEGPRFIRLGNKAGCAIRYRIADLLKWHEEQTEGGRNG